MFHRWLIQKLSVIFHRGEGRKRERSFFILFLFFSRTLILFDQFLFGLLYLCMTSLKRCICLCTTTHFLEEIQMVTHTKTLTLFFMTSVLSIFSDTNLSRETVPLSQKYKYFFSNESRKICLSLKRKKNYI